VIATRRSLLGHGTRAFGFRPRLPGPVQVRLRAVDLAGNAAEIAGEIHVPPPRRHGKSR